VNTLWCEEHDHFKRTCPWCEVDALNKEIAQLKEKLNDKNERGQITMERRLERILGEMFGRKEVVVGKVSEKLLEKWQRLSYRQNLLRLHREAVKAEFVLDQFIKLADGRNSDPNMTEKVEHAFNSDYAEQIKAWAKEEQAIEEEDRNLWAETQLELLIDPTEANYRIDVTTGEVAKVTI